MADKLRAELGAVRARHPDRLWALSVIASPERIKGYEEDGFLVFEDPTRAVVALHAMGRYGDSFARAAEAEGEVVVGHVTLPDTTPDEAEAKRILSDAGIRPVPEAACATVEAAIAAAKRIGYPVVAKILSPDILHKSEIGGVLLDIADEAGLREAFATLIARGAERAPGARLDGILVARQVKGAVEIAFGILQDPVFGPIAMVGLGGVFIEVLKDVAFRRCPFDAEEATRMIRGLRGFPLLDGARGRPKGDVKALAAALANLSVFAAGAGARLRSVDVNPVLVLPEGQGIYAADAVIEVEPAG